MHPAVERLFSCAGRTALITGSSSGIGLSMAEAIGRAGAQVILVARREAQLRENTERLRDDGVEAGWITADLSDRDEAARVAEQAQTRFGPVDILVHSAGLNLRPPMDELTPGDYDRMMAVNVDAAFLLGQALGPVMAARGWGRIINIASQQSVRAFGNSGAYGISKAAVTGLTRSQSEAWSSRGVCCNAVGPGFVRTPLTEPTFAIPGRAEALAARTQMLRNGELPDFAGVAVWLASDASAYVTGQTVFVDGGFSVA
ncbi:SDR family oxidoreductase [Kineosporia sp. NBRC 101731]|uniref:SDR family NAD(P)-dependent oxidoreductase n=1 Tax=Kineosporia sp. NBRC 101731 TaxID=3032199 RepID=UPI00249FBA17|nr:SDR family oxidoreductase [Kineosporia sp. NBRC 101731]GLY28742.1 2-deoxy-D-gluconate 3-dehydrogenase [Kineosporia sp. NBRC 101731]